MFEQVKQEIDDKIKTNGNNEITATRLNGVLQNMMDAAAEELNGYVQKTDPPSPAAGDIVVFDEYGGFGTSEKTVNDFATAAQGAKADTALQPTGVKTINNQSIVGSGNITIEGGGTDDYADLDNKPQINSVALSGNKSASDLGLATANQGAKADTAVQPAALNSYVQKSATAGLLKNDGTVDTITAGKADNAIPMPTGTDGYILEKASNEAAGVKWVEKPTNGKSAYDIWYEENGYSDPTTYNEEYFLASLKAQFGSFVPADYGTDGKPASGGTDITASASTTNYIYLVDNLSSNPTAKVMWITVVDETDPSNPTYSWQNIGEAQVSLLFKSGQSLDDVNIVNDLITGGADDVLSAEQGKLIDGKLFKYVNFTPTLSNYNIDNSNPTKVGTNSAYYHYLLAVNAGEVYYIGANRGNICYAFLSQEPQATPGESLVFATDYSSAILLRPSSLENGIWKTAYITIPEGCTYLWVDAYNASPYSTYNVSRKREDKFVTEDNISFDVAKEEVLVTNKSFNRYILDGINRWDKQTITAEDYNINGTNIGTSTIYKHYLIAVQAGDVVYMTTSYHLLDLKYALLTTNEGLLSGAALPLVNGTTPIIWSRTTDTDWVHRFVEIPQGCAYIWIDCKASPLESNTRCYKSPNKIAYTDVIEESTKDSLIPSVAAVKSYAGSNEIINNTNTDDATKALSAAMGKKLDDRFKEWIFLRRSYPSALTYSITTDGKLGTNSVYKHAIIRVEAGDEYIIKFTSSTATLTERYCFLTNNNFENASGVTLPIVEGTSVGTYYVGNQEVPQEKYITIPDGCHYLAFDFYDGRTQLYKRVEKDNLSIPKHYQSYIDAKSDVVLKRDIESNIKSDSLIFFSDYHVNNDGASYDINYGHSPALIKHLVDNTNTKKVIFGGDIFGSPGSDALRMEKMTEFLRKFSDIEYYPTIGNHEWNQSSVLNSATSTRWIDYDYNSLIKPIEKNNIKVGHDNNGNERPWYYFDNDAKKIRYVCLFAPNPSNNSGYAYGHIYSDTQLPFLESAISNLDDSWRIIIFQHIVYQNGNEPLYQNQQAIRISLADVGNRLYSKIKDINQRENTPKVILVLSGHTHVDFGEFVDNYCYSYVITCDAAYSLYKGLIEETSESSAIKVPAENGTKIRNSVYEQSFDAIHLIPTDNLILGERIGWGCNRIVHTDVNNVAVGNTVKLTETIDNVIAWASLTPNIATVNSSGVVTPVAEGDATIICYTAMVNDYDENTAELEKNGYVEYFHVKVTE